MTNSTCVLAFTALLLFNSERARAQADAEAKSVQLIEKLGGTVVRDPKLKDNPVVAVNLSVKEVKDAFLKELAALTQLRSLDLSFTAVSDVGMKELTKLSQLQ